MTLMASSSNNATMNPSLVHERVSRDSSPTYIVRCSSSTASLHILDEEEHHSSTTTTTESAPNTPVATSTVREDGNEEEEECCQPPRPKIVRFQLQPHEPDREGEDDHVVVLPGIGLVSTKNDEFSADTWLNVHEYRLMQRRRRMRDGQGLTNASVPHWDDVGLDVDRDEDTEEGGDDIGATPDVLKNYNLRRSPVTPKKEGALTDDANREETEQKYHLRSRFRTRNGSPYQGGRNQCHVSFLHPPKLPLRSSATSSVTTAPSCSCDDDDDRLDDIADE
mmetsp:Transcript_57868/g.141395  ORF Transcript_57868/g.141395 Transcript_57868/m.141395 type:complete len:279 (-) Transcript_57868:292-1128(-)